SARVRTHGHARRTKHGRASTSSDDGSLGQRGDGWANPAGPDRGHGGPRQVASDRELDRRLPRRQRHRNRAAIRKLADQAMCGEVATISIGEPAAPFRGAGSEVSNVGLDEWLERHAFMVRRNSRTINAPGSIYFRNTTTENPSSSTRDR